MDDQMFKKTSDVYGKDWKQFSNFYVAQQYHRKLEITKCRKYLSRCKDVLVAKYILADLNVFTGDRKEASQLIKELDADIDKLTDSLRLRVLALKARLNFDFKEQVKNLEEIIHFLFQ